MAAYSSAGRVPLVIWAATVDPADVPMMRSASVTSTPASDRPAMRPSAHALPAAPPPARTKARLSELPACLVASACWSSIGQFPCRGVRVTAMPSEVVVELMRRVEEGVVFMGVAFRELPVGRSRWRLPQSRDRGLRGAPTADAFMGVTSCRWITIAERLARRRRATQPALRRLPCPCRTRPRPLRPQLRRAAKDHRTPSSSGALWRPDSGSAGSAASRMPASSIPASACSSSS